MPAIAMYQVSFIYYDKGIAGHDMKSTKKKNAICSKYGTRINQFATSLTL